MPEHNIELANYYIHQESLYSSHFPQVWAVEELPTCGPNNCASCQDVGFWNGVFIGYCRDCAINHHHGKRGRGLIQTGFESRGQMEKKYPSMFDTYLSGINLNDVGDTKIDDSQERISQEILQAQNEFLESNDDLANTCPDEYTISSVNRLPFTSSFDEGYDSF